MKIISSIKVLQSQSLFNKSRLYQLNEVKQSGASTTNLDLDTGDINKNIDEDDNDEELDKDSQEDESLLGIYIIKGREFIWNFLQKSIAKWIIGVLALIGFIVYFSLAMAFNNPFDFPNNKTSSEILRNHVFAYNQSNFWLHC